MYQHHNHQQIDATRKDCPAYHAYADVGTAIGQESRWADLLTSSCIFSIWCSLQIPIKSCRRNRPSLELVATIQNRLKCLLPLTKFHCRSRQKLARNIVLVWGWSLLWTILCNFCFDWQFFTTDFERNLRAISSFFPACQCCHGTGPIWTILMTSKGRWVWRRQRASRLKGYGSCLKMLRFVPNSWRM